MHKLATRSRQILFAAAEKTFALGALTGQLACAADSFSFFARFLLGRLFKVVAAFHLAEETFTLHLFLKRFQCLIDIVVADDDLNDDSISYMPIDARSQPCRGDQRQRYMLNLLDRKVRSAALAQSIAPA